ncbi:TrfA family protein [Azospirillaceae bacterium]
MNAVAQKQNVITLPVQREAPPIDPVEFLIMAPQQKREYWYDIARARGFDERGFRSGYVGRLRSSLELWVDFVADDIKASGGKTPAEIEAEIIKFPVWADALRGAPNEILRHALFAAIQGKTRKMLQEKVVAKTDGCTLYFTGCQLDQSDFDVWLQLINQARWEPAETVCTFKAGTFLKSIGRDDGKAQHVWLKSVIDRLSNSVLTVERDGKRARSQLIVCTARDEVTKAYSVKIERGIAELYIEGWTGLNWERRKILRGKPLALWLDGYFATHAEPGAVKVETIRQRCGSETGSLRLFRQSLRSALDVLQDVGALASWSIDSTRDVVFVDRGAAISDSQRRHLDRKERSS